MNSKDFSFVILHYLAIDDTIECIESILRLYSNYNMHIVIVDNASPDKSGYRLKEKYEDNNYIDILLLDKNLGFSKGNNKGINFVNKNYNSDFIIVANNDTVFIQNNFLKVIFDEYENSNFSVLGPLVEDPDHLNNSNPLYIGKEKELIDLKKTYNMWKKQYIKSKLYIDALHPFKAFNKNSAENNDVRLPTLTQRVENIELHGCCLVFSKEYFKYYEGFEELTFMYGEETILKMNCDAYRLKMVYNPKLKIFHKEAVSTKIDNRTRKKKIQYYKRMLEASKVIYLKKKKQVGEGI